MQTVVVKRLQPSQPGARKLAQRYGEALVCVRYRHDAQGLRRYTTVELIVDEAPVASRVSPDQIVRVHIDFNNAALHKRAHAHGALWDDRLRHWYMPLHVARTLRLVRFILAGPPLPP